MTPPPWPFALRVLSSPPHLCTRVLAVAQQQTPPLTPDIPATFEAPSAVFDYVKRIAMIPMRDGVKLHTVVVVPKGGKSLPILLTRTPYDAAARAQRARSTRMVACCRSRSGRSSQTATSASIRTFAASTAPKATTS